MKQFPRPIIVIWYLLIGLILSLGQTWASLNFFENLQATGPAKILSRRIWSVTNHSTTGWMIGEPNDEGTSWNILGVKNSDNRVFQIRHQINYRGYSGIERDFEPGSIPSWTRVVSVPTPAESTSVVQVIEQLNGWPFLAWRGEARIDRRGIGARYKWCFPSSKATGTTVWDQLILFPYEPVFPGALYNALFFGGISFVCVSISRHARSRIIIAYRQQHNRCTRCKYDITNLTTCPECGQEVMHPKPASK